MRAATKGLLLFSVVATSACGAGWQREPLAPVRAVAPRQQVQVWSQGEMLRWHGVRLTEDSISGVPFVAELTCDSCRTTLPVSAVDSLRYGDPPAGFLRTIALIAGSMVLMSVILCCPGAT